LRLHISPDDPAGEIVELSSENDSLVFSAPGFGTGEVTDDSVRLPGERGSSLVIFATPEGFEFKVVLEDGASPSSYSFELQAGRLGGRLGDDRTSIELVDPAGNVVGRISAPSVFDAKFVSGAVAVVLSELSEPSASPAATPLALPEPDRKSVV
jgi:hypothetical protein